MSAPINRVPHGFLSTLDAKTLGRTPSDTSRDLQLGMDLTPFYLADLPMNRTVGNDSAPNIFAPSLFCSVVIPAGELWFVYGIAVTVKQAASTDLCYPSVGFRPAAFAGTTVYHPVATTDTKGVGATGTNANATAAWFSATPIPMNAGAQFVARGEISIGIGGATAALSVIHRTVIV